MVASMVLSSCAPKEESSNAGKKRIKIGYLPITHAAPLYLEQEKAGEFEEFEIELLKFGSWPDLIDALNAGQIDGASVLVEAAMKARGMGVPIKAVALGHKDGNVVVVAPEIKEPADLKGKTFAIPHKFSSHNILLFEMLKQANISEEEVNVVEMAPAEMPAALAQKRIAGYAVAEPFGASSVVLGNGEVLRQSGELWQDSICCVLVLREALIEEYPAATKEFISEYAAAGELADSKSEEVQSVLRKHMKVEEDVLDLSLEWISYDDLVLDQPSYEKLLEYLKEMELDDGLPTYEEFVEPTLLEAALLKG